MNGPGKLSITTPSENEIRMTRVFAAPRQLVFDAWTKPDVLKQWLYGPDGHSLEVCELDLRPGGSLRFVWRLPDGKTMGLSGVYKEIAPPEKIVHSEVFDEDWTGGKSLVTLTFSEQNNQTTLVMTVRYSSREVRDMVLQTGMTEGVEMGYARLEKLLIAEAAH